MLQGSEINIQLLLGHYAHSLGCFHEAALHFMQASKVNRVLASLKISFGTFSEYIVWSSVSVEQYFDLKLLPKQNCRQDISIWRLL